MQVPKTMGDSTFKPPHPSPSSHSSSSLSSHQFYTHTRLICVPSLHHTHSCSHQYFPLPAGKARSSHPTPQLAHSTLLQSSPPQWATEIVSLVTTLIMEHHVALLPRIRYFPGSWFSPCFQNKMKGTAELTLVSNLMGFRITMETILGAYL